MKLAACWSEGRVVRVALREIGRGFGIGGAARAGEVPGAVVDEAAVLFFPEGVVGEGVDERGEGAGDDGDFGAAHDFEQAEGVADLLIAPMVAGGDADAEDGDVGGVEQHRDRLEIRSRGPEGALGR